MWKFAVVMVMWLAPMAMSQAYYDSHDAWKIRGKTILGTTPTNGQTLIYNSTTRRWEFGSSYTAPSGYSATVTAQTTVTVTAATHAQGTAPTAWCFDNSTPALATACSYTVSSIGDVVFSWSPAFTGSVIIRGPGANAGAAGDVVGPSSSTAGALTCFSGTSGKILTGCTPLSTTGAIPFVTAPGVLGQDGNGPIWDAANNRLGLNTGATAIVQPFYVNQNGNAAYIGNGGVGVGTTSDGGGSGTILRFGVDTTGTAFGYLQVASPGIANRALFLNPSNGNVVVNGAAATTYGLDVQSSGTSGTFRAWDQSGAGSTLLVVQAGAAQSGNLLSVKNNAGTEVAGISAAGGAVIPYLQTSTAAPALYVDKDTGYLIASNRVVGFSSTTNSQGTLDTGLARNAAGILEVNNGTAGTLRDFLARQYRNTPVAVASLQACNAGNKGSAASVNDALAPAWGVTVANGGAAYAAVTCNGTNWTVTGI